MASDLEFDWHPAKFMLDHGAQDFALLILNQPLRNGTSLRRLWRNSLYRVAADGGANRLHELSSFQGKFSNLQAIIGDLDSLRPHVRDFYSSQFNPTKIIHDPDQQSTDFGKAISYIRSSLSPATDIDIVALGGIGGRLDQGLSQLHHLYLFQPGDAGYPHGRIFLVSGSSLTFLLKRGTHRIHVREDEECDEDPFGKHVGIIPLKEPATISTRGLEWDVTEWETSMGGQLSTSNHVRPETRVVEVETDKDVLFTIALRQVESEDDG